MRCRFASIAAASWMRRPGVEKGGETHGFSRENDGFMDFG
jgi:hypothetical protein